MSKRRDHATASHHAIERAMQRSDLSTLDEARVALEIAWERGVRLPWRFGRMLGRRTGGTVPRKQRAEYRVSGLMLLVRRGPVIATCWKLSEAQLRCVASWRATGVWELRR